MIQQATDTTDFTAMREAMVACQLRTNAVDDPRIVAVMLRVPREAYLPEDVARIAYRDTAVPLGRNRAANAPLATARLLTAATITPTDSVLLIGAAGGYTAAVLAELAATVTAVESDPDLATAARAALGGNARVTVVEGPLEAGAPDGAPYDVMIVDGAVEHLPDALVAQVKTGGTVASGVVDNGVFRLAAGTRSEGGFALRDFADTDCVALPGFARPKSFQF
ncbi:protein-L-isoaspartate O-methyltransferase [Hephaestia sp. GCM10023244]|uniref:protein-L-isoaspartate O-methyltransferase family protein n=1 Tax=unclassified Hephaestia TaxID=2631281 RepID=UPI0020771A59|nr:protein-L-isoaspartate O-methyltransferase [Hephaestia sp. MAHUQ-44]MCM8730240.1 protein-L-isoaspartate O-methyltransferase [Hephaestia sp. MAHUQ-44]